MSDEFEKRLADTPPRGLSGEGRGRIAGRLATDALDAQRRWTAMVMSVAAGLIICLSGVWWSVTRSHVSPDTPPPAAARADAPAAPSRADAPAAASNQSKDSGYAFAGEEPRRASKFQDARAGKGEAGGAAAPEGAHPFDPQAAPAPEPAPHPGPAPHGRATPRPEPRPATGAAPNNHPLADADVSRSAPTGERLERGRELHRRDSRADGPPAVEVLALLAERRQLSAEGRLEEAEKLRKEIVDRLNQSVADGKDEAKKLEEALQAQEKAKKQVFKPHAGRPSVARVYLGDGNKLELLSLHVSVLIEGPRARTVIDHVFRNPFDRQLEGSFEYPLPTGASAGYFAMFHGITPGAPVPERFARDRKTDKPAGPMPADALARMAPQQLTAKADTTEWGRLQEGRVVAKEAALEVYEEITRSQIDPGLLEYAGGNTFTGRVFPIAPRGLTRIVFSYEELLPAGADARTVYRFVLPDGPLAQVDFRLTASADECRDPKFEPADCTRHLSRGRLTYQRYWAEKCPGGEAVFAFTPADRRVQATSGRQGADGPHHLFARLRPELPVIHAAPNGDAAVFLLDTSMSESPDRFAVSVKLLRAILEKDPAVRRFNVLCFDVSARWLNPGGWMTNDAPGRKAVLDRLDGLLLEGATDVGAALEALCGPVFDLPAGSPLNVFLLSDGQVTWGEADVPAMAAKFEARCPYKARFHAYRIGLGAENTALFDALTRRDGGVFQCHGDADVAAAATAHRRRCLTVEKIGFVGGPAATDLLVAGRRAAVYPGGELVVAARANEAGATALRVVGTFDGKPYQADFAVEFRADGELAPRGWGELAVAGLLALGDPEVEPLAVAYCRQFGIASRVASFLVLENEADYKRLNLESDNAKAPADLAEMLESAWRNLGKPATPRQVFERFLARADKRTKLLSGPDGPAVRRLLDLLTDADFELGSDDAGGGLPSRTEVPADYAAKLAPGADGLDAMIAEAARRLAAGDRVGAVRALSGVVERHPGRSDALRLVGYRLMGLKMPAAAARLFARVQESRPFEPHSYRDLARSLESAGKWAWAAVNYELVLAGTWHQRFRDTMAVVAREEYVRMLRTAVRDKTLAKAVRDRFGARLEQLSAAAGEDDLRVTITWNTDSTDIDLWVIEPDGTKCFYQHTKTVNGGELSADMTQGFGPERYRIKKAKPGVYTVKAHYFRANPNLLAGETHVEVTITRFADTPREVVERQTIVLRTHNQEVDVAKVRF
jgi:hypothetical protein